MKRPDGLLHADVNNDELPDAGHGACCMGSAVYGPGRCTCWEPEYDAEQKPLRTDVAAVTRPAMCGDCAFRSDSPERNDEVKAAYDHEDIEAMVNGDREFWCHDGMRLRVAQTHPSGARLVEPAERRLAYDPPMVGAIPYKASGAPADRCAGLAARRRSRARGETS